MKIAILGASGGCGQELVKQAVERGHEVTAVVRSQTWQPTPKVPVLRGDLTDSHFLGQAVAEKDAVLTAVGLRLRSIAPWSKPETPDFLERCARGLIPALHKAGVRRVLAISAGGVGESRSQVPAAFRAFIAGSALRHAYAQLDVFERLLKGAGLELCLVRPTGLTDGPRTGKALVCPTFVGRATISRADVAAWMLDELASPRYTGQAPMITVTGAS